MWILPILTIVIGALVLLVVALMAGPIIDPLYEVVVNDSAVQAMGYDRGAEVATRVGLKYVLPLLALSLVIWFLVLRLREDVYLGRR